MSSVNQTRIDARNAETAFSRNAHLCAERVLTYRIEREGDLWSVTVKPENGPKVSGFNRRCPWAALLMLAGLAAGTVGMREALRADREVRMR